MDLLIKDLQTEGSKIAVRETYYDGYGESIVKERVSYTLQFYENFIRFIFNSNNYIELNKEDFKNFIESEEEKFTKSVNLIHINEETFEKICIPLYVHRYKSVSYEEFKDNTKYEILRIYYMEPFEL